MLQAMGKKPREALRCEMEVIRVNVLSSSWPVQVRDSYKAYIAPFVHFSGAVRSKCNCIMLRNVVINRCMK